jgi:hypothetical protein
MALSPVTFPPGRARLPTTPRPDRIANSPFLAARAAGVPPRQDQIHLQAHQLSRQTGEPLVAAVGRSILDDEALPSTYPRSRRPCRKPFKLAALIAVDVLSSMPMR